MMDLLARRRGTFGAGTLISYTDPLIVQSASGAWIVDAEGHELLDAYNNVPHVGHCHPYVVARGAEQLARVNTHSRYLHEGVTAYAERLLGLFPDPLDRVQFACTGTEANELALRMARVHSGADGVIVSSTNYHGNSSALSALSTALPTPEAFPPWARSIDIADGTDGEVIARQVDTAIKALKDAGRGLAALIIDPIFSFEGLPALPRGALTQAAEYVRKAGGLYIADEVQSGFGRTGDAMWGWEWLGPAPDIVTLGKPMANGYPVSAVISSAEIVDGFVSNGAYFNTYAATPVGLAMADAVLDVLEREDLLASAATSGQALQDDIASLIGDHRSIFHAVRGRGLYLGLETRDTRVAAHLMESLRSRGVLTGTTGRMGNVIKIRPPMCFADRERRFFTNALRDVAGQMGAAA